MTDAIASTLMYGKVGLFPCVKIEDFEYYDSTANMTASWVPSSMDGSLYTNGDGGGMKHFQVYMAAGSGTRAMSASFDSVDKSDYNYLFYRIRDTAGVFPHIVVITNNGIEYNYTSSATYGGSYINEFYSLDAVCDDLESIKYIFREDNAKQIMLDDIYLIDYSDNFKHSLMDISYSDEVVYNTMKIPGRYGGIPVYGGHKCKSGNFNILVRDDDYNTKMRDLKKYMSVATPLLLVMDDDAFPILIKKLAISRTGGKDRALIGVKIDFVEVQIEGLVTNA